MANNFPAIRKQLTAPNVMEMVQNRIGEKAGTFVSSVLDLIGSDNLLMNCDPNMVMKEALKAAALDLPVSKSLGFAYVIPYKGKPQFQMGYRGFIQLAIRTGQFRHLNADVIYEGETFVHDRIKGKVTIEGKPTSDKAIAYFGYMELCNGFEKTVVWTRDEVTAHAKRFSKSFSKPSSPWQSDFDSMAKKTMLLQLKSYMPMSVEMQSAMEGESTNTNPRAFDADVSNEIDGNANGEIIDIPSGGVTAEEQAEIHASEVAEMEGGAELEPDW